MTSLVRVSLLVTTTLALIANILVDILGPAYDGSGSSLLLGGIVGGQLALFAGRGALEPIAGSKVVPPASSAAACYHPRPVEIESIIPGIGIVAWWCPSCDVHGPDRKSLGWTVEHGPYGD